MTPHGNPRQPYNLQYKVIIENLKVGWKEDRQSLAKWINWMNVQFKNCFYVVAEFDKARFWWILVFKLAKIHMYVLIISKYELVYPQNHARIRSLFLLPFWQVWYIVTFNTLTNQTYDFLQGKQWLTVCWGWMLLEKKIK